VEPSAGKGNKEMLLALLIFDLKMRVQGLAASSFAALRGGVMTDLSTTMLLCFVPPTTNERTRRRFAVRSLFVPSVSFWLFWAREQGSPPRLKRVPFDEAKRSDFFNLRRNQNATRENGTMAPSTSSLSS